MPIPEPAPHIPTFGPHVDNHIGHTQLPFQRLNLFEVMAKGPLNTALTETFGVAHPIMLAGMNVAAGSKLTAAVTVSEPEYKQRSNDI
jgi:hypothetical protein